MRILTVIAALALLAAGPMTGRTCLCDHPMQGSTGEMHDGGDAVAECHAASGSGEPCCPGQESSCDGVLACGCCAPVSVLAPDPVRDLPPGGETVAVAVRGDGAPAESVVDFLRPPIA